MIQDHTLEQIVQRFQFLEAKLNGGLPGDEIASVTREYSDLKPVVDTIEQYRGLIDEIAGAEDMLADPEMKALAEEELPALRETLAEAEAKVKIALGWRQSRRSTRVCSTFRLMAHAVFCSM